ncbi:MAG TPA: YihY/virulence factor BrkB family protein [Steroidobacteraceae bacterium]
MRLRFRNIRRSIVAQSISCWLDHSASSLGAALAFYTLFSVAPILIIALAIAGWVFGPHTAETELLAQLQALTGRAGADALKNLLASAHYSDKKGMAAVVGVVTLVVGATSVFGELQHALDVIWGAPKSKRETGWWRVLRTRLLSFGMVLGVGFLLLVSLIASAVLAAFGGWLEAQFAGLQIVLPLLDVAVSFGMTVVLFAMIYKYVPHQDIAWRDVWIGAVVTAFLFTIGKSLIGLYLGRSSFNGAYGAAGSLIVLLLWIYYSAQIFLLGAEFTHVFAYSQGSRAVAPGSLHAPTY